jgi:hypothetical protein
VPRSQDAVAGELANLGCKATDLQARALAQQLADDEAVIAALAGYGQRSELGPFGYCDCLLAVTPARAIQIDTSRGGWFSSPKFLECSFVYLADVIEVSYEFHGEASDILTPGYGVYVRAPRTVVRTFRRAATGEQMRSLVEFVRIRVAALQDPAVQDHPTSFVDELERLGGLKERGLLSDEEFEQAKNRLLLG